MGEKNYSVWLVKGSLGSRFEFWRKFWNTEDSKNRDSTVLLVPLLFVVIILLFQETVITLPDFFRKWTGQTWRKNYKCKLQEEVRAKMVNAAFDPNLQEPVIIIRGIYHPSLDFLQICLFLHHICPEQIWCESIFSSTYVYSSLLYSRF